jgi:hypothetical protein
MAPVTTVPTNALEAWRKNCSKARFSRIASLKKLAL